MKRIYKKVLSFNSQPRLNRGHLSTSKGFTLIELLIVIAILGILAAVIILAINPVEQLARAKDSGRESSVTQLGTALQSYVTNQGQNTYPIPGTTTGWTITSTANSSTNMRPNTWQSNLIAAKEINNAISVPFSGNTNFRTSCATNNDGGICYATNGSATSQATDAIIYTVAESNSADIKAYAPGGTTRCSSTSGNYPVFIWVASQGKTGVACVTADPPGYLSGTDWSTLKLN